MTCARCGCHLPNPDCYVCWDDGAHIRHLQARDEWREAREDDRRDEILLEQLTNKTDAK